MKIKYLIMAFVISQKLFGGDFSGGLFIGKPFAIGPVKNDELIGVNNQRSGLIGARLEYVLSKNNELALNFDSHHFGVGEKNPIQLGIPLTDTSFSSEWEAFGLTAEWKHFFDNKLNSLVGLGVSAVDMNATMWSRPTSGGQWSGSTTRLKQSACPSFKVGVGYYFTRMLHADVAYNYISVKKNGEDGFGLSSITSIDLIVGITWGR